MLVKAIKKEDLPDFIDSLVHAYEVVAPVKKEFKYAFDRITSSGQVELEYDTTLLPPRKYLLPQKEVLLKYGMGGKSGVEACIESGKKVIFGVHSCDLHGVWLLDDIFAEGRKDAHYLTRRDNTLIIGIDCKAPCAPNSFCKSMGTLRPGGGYDMFLTDLGDVYAVQVASQAGRTLLDHGEFFYPDYQLKERYYDAWKRKIAEFPDRLEFDADRLPVMLAEAYDDFLWDALEEKCFDCGACTVVCPTCYCFDVQDEAEINMERGIRYRKWDSCQLQDFALLASGENLRGKRSDRLRHRFFRKGKYFKEKFGRFACVGCGRCGRACLVHIDVLRVFNQLKG
ncbi:MAG: 4Fe-4S dicluster domain-containing protein [Nitrospirota bacterium]